MLNIALPKGRLGERVYSLLSSMGYACGEYAPDSRKLVFTDENNKVSYFWVKPSDVPVYVQLGAADVGVAGKDVIDELMPDVYEIADLKMGNCRMCVAAKEDFADDFSKPLRVATKFSRSAAAYFSSVGREIQLIKLNGSIELAPVLGMADVIFDIVESGKTLKENNLRIVAYVKEISTRLIANKAAYKFKYNDISVLKRRSEGAAKND